jgi:DNA gyrase subunit A
MATKNGVVKKTKVKEFENMRSSGLIAIKLRKDDELVSVHETGGNDHIIIITKKGKGIRFPEKNARSMGRATSGVRGINLNKDDEVIGMEVFSEKLGKPDDKRRKFFRDILTISEKGLGKRTKIRLFPIQKRAGKGVKAAVVNDKTGPLAAEAFITHKTKQIIITSKKGQVIKLPIKNIPQMGRATQGVILMRFAKKGDGVAAVTALTKKAVKKEKS